MGYLYTQINLNKYIFNKKYLNTKITEIILQR